MSAVRAKMYVSKTERHAYDPSATKITMQVVSRGDENKAWAAATPTGTLELSIKNPIAAAALADQLGQEFYVDITPVGEADDGG